MVNDYKNGALKIDFECLNGALKIHWLKSLFKNFDSMWDCKAIFEPVGGLNVLLTCALKLISSLLSCQAFICMIFSILENVVFNLTFVIYGIIDVFCC